MTTAEEYRTASSSLYDQAMIELEAGDLRQASEKLWGASAQALKSLAERRGWQHGTHREFYRIIRRLRDEMDTDDLREQFVYATELHSNFYENYMDESEIRKSTEKVEALIDTLSRL